MVLYDLLCRVSTETLLQVAADPQHLGAQIGVSELMFRLRTYWVIPTSIA